MASPIAKFVPQDASKSEMKKSWAGRVPHLKPGKYADGMPLHEVEYLACKLILRPNRFTSRRSLFDFAKVLRRPADECGVKFSTEEFEDAPLKIREVLFVDTKDFKLYNNAFILRRRIPYTDGFPSGEPEIVFKFRHPDMQKAAETDVRPQILGDHRVKFKCQALPLKDELGGIRLLFSHNVQFPRSHVSETDVFSFSTVTKILPVLERIRDSPSDEITLVNDTIIEEVLQDIGSLNFGSGLQRRRTWQSGAPGENTGRSSGSSPTRSDSATGSCWHWMRCNGPNASSSPCSGPPRIGWL